MQRPDWKIKTGSVLLGAICAAMLAGILVAGLWPFHAPKNEVTWLDGLRFGRFGTVLSLGTIKTSNGGDDTSGSLDLWLAPRSRSNSSSLLAFYDPNAPSGLLLRQQGEALVLERETWSRPHHSRDRIYIDDAFRSDRYVFITITSDGHRTDTYVNGIPAQGSRRFRFSANDLGGRVVVANSPVENDSWSGELRGLAFYSRELTAAQVLRHYQTWTQTGRPDVTKDEHAFAVYLFDERSGSVIRNQASTGPNLYIPERYMELHHTLLQWPWNGYYPGWSHWKSLLINIGGFIPFGFFFYAYAFLVLRVRRAALATILLGAAVSLTIEILQSFLPTRDSGMTDIITNTLGTGIGVVLCRSIGYAHRRLSESGNPIAELLLSFVADVRDSKKDELALTRNVVNDFERGY